LGIDSEQGAKAAGIVVGKGVGKAMPERIRGHLKTQYEGEIRSLSAAMMSPYPDKWLQAL